MFEESLLLAALLDCSGSACCRRDASSGCRWYFRELDCGQLRSMEMRCGQQNCSGKAVEGAGGGFHEAEGERALAKR